MFKFTIRNIVIGFCLCLYACITPTPPQQNAQLTIVTTIAPLYSFTTNVAGDNAQVINLIPPGTSIHSWQLKPSDVKTIAQADLLVMNGLLLEEFVEDIIQAVENKDLKIVYTTTGIPSDELIQLDESNDHDHIGVDPHVWLSPQFAQIGVENIRDALIEIDPQHKAAYEDNATAYLQRLSHLSDMIMHSIEDSVQKNFLVFHSAYDYYFKTFKLFPFYKGTIQAAPGQQLSAAKMKELIERIKSENISIMFTEPQFSPKIITSLENELDLTTYELDPIGSELSPKGYENNLISITDTFVQAFKEKTTTPLKSSHINPKI